MKVIVKNNKKIKAKCGDIVVLQNYFSKKEEYYLIAHNNGFYSLINLENGETFIEGIWNTADIDTFINDMDSRLYSGNKAKLILGGK